MPLTPDEKRAVTKHLADWSVKSLFEGGVLDDTDREELWSEAEEFVEECAQALRDWGHATARKEEVRQHTEYYFINAHNACVGLKHDEDYLKKIEAKLGFHPLQINDFRSAVVTFYHIHHGNEQFYNVLPDLGKAIEAYLDEEDDA